MSDKQAGTIEQIAQLLARILQPLKEDLAANGVISLFAELGVRLTPAQAANAALKSALDSTVNNTTQLLKKTGDLIKSIDSGNVAEIVSRGLDVIKLAKDAIAGFTNIANAINGLGLAGFNAGQFPERLFNYLVFRNLDSVSGLNEALEFISVLQRTQFNAGSVDPNNPPFETYSYHLDKIGAWLDSAGTQLKTLYGWGSNSFDGKKLFGVAQRILARTGAPVLFDQSGPVAKLDIVFAEAVPKTDINPNGLAITVKHRVDGMKQTFSQDDWSVEMGISGQLAVGAQVIIQPNDNITVIPPSGDFKGETYIQFTAGKPDGTPFVILGQAGASRIETKQLVAKAGVGFSWNGSRADGVLKVSAEVKHGKIVISLAGADGFIGKILSGIGLESDFDLGLGYSTKEGVFFFGSATLEIQLPIHITLGPVDISALTISIGLAGGKFPIGISANIKAALGPLVAVVEQIGMKATLSFPADRKGNAGPVDLSLGFKPPNGVGLSIDAGIIKGGGYLFLDFEKEEYAGALELVFSGFITLKAIGLITTKMPDGSKGFSLLIIITAEFGTGIQLGFGFTLLGVGGLLGLNRTMRLQPLMEGVRTGAINSIMFPKDVIANAPKIISDLRAIFPPQEGIFLIGPMAKLGWGTPTLISLSLGIIIEIPGNIAILGVLKVALPAEDAAILILQVNFAGAIEFDKKRVYFFAALFESRVLFLTIEGEMGLLVAFGDDANFVVSVGGFHPRFSPPPLPFPSPKRISINLLSSPIQRVRVEGYFAVTTNTVQFGARVEVFFGLDEINVQGHIAFDALFQFSPFYFIIEISASFSVNVFGIGLFSVSVRMSLEGPTPWRARGTGSISFFFFDVSVDFDVTWGESRNTMLPPIAVMPVIKGELEKAENWRALLPPGANLLVSLRKLPAAEAALVLHPVGVLRVSQRALPLELKLDKVGNQKPNDVNRLTLKVLSGGLGKKGDVLEQFAPAQFQNMSDGEKLSRPAFGPERGGVDLSVSGQQVASSKMVKRIVRYEEIIIDSNFKRFARRFSVLASGLFSFFLNGASVTKCELSQHQKKQFQPFAETIAVQAETYSVAFQSNNKAHAAEAMSFASEASARDYLQRQIAKDPNLSDELHVIPEYERAA